MTPVDIAANPWKMFDLTGRTALVTGASRGLGFEAASSLAKAGAKVILNGRDTAALTVARERLVRNGGLAEIVAFDVADGPRVDAAMTPLLDRCGAIDILINNAGPRDRRGLDNLAVEAFSNLISAHLIASYRLARIVAPGMRERKAGSIINISSVAAFLGAAGDVAYSAAKAGILGLTRALAAELGPSGITVNAIAPGAFATEINEAAISTPEVAAMIARRAMLGRPGRPDEISGLILLLASSAGRYITGQTIVIDGGMTTHLL